MRQRNFPWKLVILEVFKFMEKSSITLLFHFFLSGSIFLSVLSFQDKSYL